MSPLRARYTYSSEDDVVNLEEASYGIENSEISWGTENDSPKYIFE